MPTNFPTSLDTITNPTSTDTLNSPSHSAQHITENDAIEALEAKVGINSSADATSLDYKLKNASSSNPGHKHTLAQGATDVTASAAELNYSVGVTSAIQTQLNAKALKGANTDITSLGGITTPLSVAQGGTGLASTTAYAVLCGGTTTTGALQSIASVGTTGYVLTSNGAGALPTFQEATSFGVISASDTLILSADTERTESSTSYVKKKSIYVIYPGTYRVKFDFKTSVAGVQIYGRIYKNGVAFGSEQVEDTGSYVTKSADLVFSSEDTIELWAHGHSNPADAYVRNFRIYGTKTTTSSVITD